jgi:hypothetical protein
MPRKPSRAKALGVTDAEYERLLAAQGGHCALCPNVPKRLKKDGTPYRLHADHDHKTGKVRGLLCWKCNDALPTWVTADWCLRASGYLRGAPQPRERALDRYGMPVVNYGADPQGTWKRGVAAITARRWPA